jgi:hypothetical protein
MAVGLCRPIYKERLDAEREMIRGEGVGVPRSRRLALRIGAWRVGGRSEVINYVE